MTDTARLRTSPWAPAGASSLTSTIEASGAWKWIGLKVPALIGPWGSRADLMATSTPAPVVASVEFTTPGTWGLEPAKSATISSPRTVSVSRMSTGSRRPSP